MGYNVFEITKKKLSQTNKPRRVGKKAIILCIPLVKTHTRNTELPTSNHYGG